MLADIMCLTSHCQEMTHRGISEVIAGPGALQGFQEALQVHAEQLVEDPVVHTHLSALYDTLLEQNLIRLIEPFSCVQIKHLADLIKLPLETVLNKLAQVRSVSLHIAFVKPPDILYM